MCRRRRGPPGRTQALLPGTDCPAPRNPPDHHVVHRHDQCRAGAPTGRRPKSTRLRNRLAGVAQPARAADCSYPCAATDVLARRMALASHGNPNTRGDARSRLVQLSTAAAGRSALLLLPRCGSAERLASERAEAHPYFRLDPRPPDAARPRSAAEFEWAPAEVGTAPPHGGARRSPPAVRLLRLSAQIGHRRTR